MKGEECQGTIQGSTSSVGLNLWNETLEYLQTKNPSWSLSKDHLHTIGKILLDKSIKNKAWMSTCYMLQNLLLIGDFIPVIVNSSENTLEKILCSYQSYQPEYQDCVVRVLVNLLNSVAGRTFVFGSENGKILVKYCVQICCNGLLGGTTNLLFKRCAALAFNISFEDTGDEIEVEICSAITAALKESIDDKTAIYLLCCLLRIMERNQEVKCLISVMGFEWPNLTKLSDEVKNMHASLKVLCSSS